MWTIINLYQQTRTKNKMQVKVKDLKIGQRVKFNETYVYVQSHKDNKVIVSKKENSPYVFSLSYFSGRFDDLLNRVIVLNR